MIKEKPLMAKLFECYQRSNVRLQDRSMDSAKLWKVS